MRKAQPERSTLAQYEFPDFIERRYRQAARVTWLITASIGVAVAVPAALIVPPRLWVSSLLVYVAMYVPISLAVYVVASRSAKSSDDARQWASRLDRADWLTFDGGARPWHESEVVSRLGNNRSDAARALMAGWYVRNGDAPGIAAATTDWTPATDVPRADLARFEAVTVWLSRDANAGGEAAAAAAQAIRDPVSRRRRRALLEIESARWAAKDDAAALQMMREARALIGGDVNEFSTDADRNQTRRRQLLGWTASAAWACLFMFAARIAAP